MRRERIRPMEEATRAHPPARRERQTKATTQTNRPISNGGRYRIFFRQ